MKLFLVLVFCVLSFGSLSARQHQNLLDTLKKEISQKNKYEKRKLNRIRNLKNELLNDSTGRFNKLLQLFNEYEYYQFDSAYRYGNQLLDLSFKDGDKAKIAVSKLKIAALLLHGGMFKETFDLLKEINTRSLDQSHLYEYYCLQSGAYSNLAIYNDNVNFTKRYNLKAISFLDSAIKISAPNSFEQLFSMGNRQVVAGETLEPPVYFTKILEAYQISEHQRARILTGMAAFYRKPNQHSIRIKLLAQSAIYDLRSSVKETLASLLLAEELAKTDHLNDAYIFIQQSRDDASFYGNKLRKLKIESVFPEIASRINIISEREKNRFIIYLLSVTCITIIILLTLFVLFIQLKKLRSKEKIIEEKNIALESFNIQLVTVNEKLREYVTVNEQYIGYFFEMVSVYISKLDKLKKKVERKIITKRYTEVITTLNEINIKEERALLFRTFDKAFIRIFPNFLHDINAMLPKEDQIWPRALDVLNVELRIFALIRLGINDISTIAAILDYSENTVYIYKMRIRAKAIVSGEQFDETLMAIKAI